MLSLILQRLNDLTLYYYWWYKASSHSVVAWHGMEARYDALSTVHHAELPFFFCYVPLGVCETKTKARPAAAVG